MEAFLFHPHELVVARAVARKMRVELLQHRIAVGGRFEPHVLELKPIHRFELHALQVGVNLPPGLLKHFIEDELHHPEGRAGVELVAVAHNSGVATPNVRVLLEHRDLEAASCQQHGGGQSAGPGADDDDVLLHGVFLHKAEPRIYETGGAGQ